MHPEVGRLFSLCSSFVRRGLFSLCSSFVRRGLFSLCSSFVRRGLFSLCSSFVRLSWARPAEGSSKQYLGWKGLVISRSSDGVRKKGDQGRRHEDLTNIYRPIMVNDGLPIKTETVNGGSNNGKQGAPVTVNGGLHIPINTYLIPDTSAAAAPNDGATADDDEPNELQCRFNQAVANAS